MKNTILSLCLIPLISLSACGLEPSASERPSAGERPSTVKTTAVHSQKPNVVIFYVDDLGYGDLGVYGAKGVQTPNVDALAHNGIRFTDAHTSAATCTPSRYSLLAGEHAFRKNARILKGDAPLLIGTDQPTLPRMLKKAGYQTAVVGKWHLGLGNGNVDWNQAIKPGPLEIGFDYSFLLPATGDRVPTVYMENHHILNLSKDDPISVNYKKKIGHRPTGNENPELVRYQPSDDGHSKTIINGISRMGWMAGGKSAEWVDEDFYQVFTDKANHFIAKNKNEPFFLFFSFHDIHVPRLPNKRFQGKSEMGLRGDAIVQMDWITGQVVKQLKTQGVFDNTIIIFTSDNGAVLSDGYEDKAIELVGEHKENGIYRGGKYSAFEAGTRVPTILHFPNRVKPGVSDALMSQIDIYASLAQYLGIELAADEAIDSEVHLDAWLNADKSGRTELAEESSTLSLRVDQWKYIRPSNDGKKRADYTWQRKRIETGTSTKAQLYNLADDPSEQRDIAAKFPERLTAMEAKLVALEAKTTR
ncbi:arylsulfatase [Paraglaciecola aquimarina]|uniref:Arylsulfatase n=1 Tax=Paraglaciecola aquimarina TaxID=1235557 RepID=A0ABU3SWS0_9ALTE|nr:arylsulfatase [Paraglaciecola aquimarina]MDU0354454.1 arylsulfatase [Paraglaciecola aquimarina]